MKLLIQFLGRKLMNGSCLETSRTLLKVEKFGLIVSGYSVSVKWHHSILVLLISLFKDSIS